MEQDSSLSLNNKRKFGSDGCQEGEREGEREGEKEKDMKTSDLLSMISTAHKQILEEDEVRRKQIEEKILELDQKIQKWETYKQQMSEAAAQAKNKIKLDIGGTIFATSKSTLLSFEDSFFGAMLNSGNFSPGDDGTYFIDRSPLLFHHIIEYMRSGDSRFYSKLSTGDKDLLKQEMDYYQISLPPTVLKWNKDIWSRHMLYSEDGATASTTFQHLQYGIYNSATAISATATDSFKVRVAGLSGNTSLRLGLMVGFLDWSKYKTEDCSISGRKVVPECFYGRQCSGELLREGSILECIRDRANRTISFSLDGIETNIVISNVPDIDLYALCDFYDRGSVELIPSHEQS